MTASPPDTAATPSGSARRRGRALGAWARKPRSAQSRLRRRLSSGARMIAALALVGGVYTAFAPGASAEEQQPTLSASAEQGKTLYNDSCITCHGINAQGVDGRGPSLIGVGSASVEFQVGSGRMPAPGQSAQIERKTPVFTLEQAQQIGAYIEALGGGPELPAGNDLSSGGNIATGGDLFRVNCSSCHAFAAGGGALSSGKSAPSMGQSTDRQIYAAMLTGPQNMPVFGDNQLNPTEKRDIIAYIQNMKSDEDPGGFGLGRLGPVTEGLVVFLVGMVGLIFATLWIAGKS